MKRGPWRGALALLGLAGVVCPSAAAEETTDLQPSVICEAPAAAGRFRCDVELRTRQGTLAWADVEVIKTADFILPLRGRVGPRDASTHEADIYRWSLGFVARDRGAGDVSFRVRGVVCHGERCLAQSTEIKGSVLVGR